MKKYCLAIVALLSFATFGENSYSDSYTTSWGFSTRNLATKVDTKYAAMDDGLVVMPIGSSWTCHKSKVSLVGTSHVAAFYCSDGKATATAIAACSPSKEDIDVADMIIGEINSSNASSMQFSVGCKTRRAP